MNADTNTKKDPEEVKGDAYEHIDALLALTVPRDARRRVSTNEPSAGEHAVEAKEAVTELTARLESALTGEENAKDELEHEIANRDSFEEGAKRDGESIGLAKALEIVQDVERGLISLTEARDRIQRLEG